MEIEKYNAKLRIMTESLAFFYFLVTVSFKERVLFFQHNMHINSIFEKWFAEDGNYVLPEKMQKLVFCCLKIQHIPL